MKRANLAIFRGGCVAKLAKCYLVLVDGIMKEPGRHKGAKIRSAWKLREEAGRRGYLTSHKQLEGFLRWGLVLPPVDGVWSEYAVERVIHAQRLRDSAWTLWRRAIHMHKSFPVPAMMLRRAMVRTLRSIEAPQRKMRLLVSALRQEAKKLEDPGFGGTNRKHSLTNFPDPKKWRASLHRNDIDDRLFGDQASMMCHFAHVLEIANRGTSLDVSKIPFEERVIFMMIRKLSAIVPGPEESTDRAESDHAK